MISKKNTAAIKQTTVQLEAAEWATVAVTRLTDVDPAENDWPIDRSSYTRRTREFKWPAVAKDAPSGQLF